MTHQSKATFMEQNSNWLPNIATIFSSGLFISLLVGKVVLLH